MVDLRIVFMGTPEFAVASLQILVANNCPVVAVITAPDRKQGRGQKVVPSPVKDYALSQNIPVLQPTNLKSPVFITELKLFKANLQVVVAFRMLPEIVWQMPALGTFILHASLLPDYRGAAPINWAIINGEKETGVTTFYLKKEIDTGAIILQEKEKISETDNVGSLYNRLMISGAKLVLSTVELIREEGAITREQSEGTSNKRAPKIFKDTCEINWNLPFSEINNFIRGLNPYPAAWTQLDGKTCKIFAISKADISSAANVHDVITDHKKNIYIRAANGWVKLLELQMEGKKRMSVGDYLRGNPLTNLPDVE